MHNGLFRKLFVTLSFAFAFVINPAYVAGCGAEEDEPAFGEAEMLELLDEANGMDATVFSEGAAEYEIELALTQTEGDDTVSSRGSLFASSAYACGSRSFMQSASACDTYTALIIEGTLTVRRVDGDEPVVVVEDLPVEGEINAGRVNSLAHSTLNLQFEGGYASWLTEDAEHFALTSFNAQDLGEDVVSINYQLED